MKTEMSALSAAEVQICVKRSDSHAVSITLFDDGHWQMSRRHEGEASHCEGTLSRTAFAEMLQALMSESTEDEPPFSADVIRGHWFIRLFVAGVLLRYENGPVVPRRLTPFRTFETLLKSHLDLAEGILSYGPEANSC